MQPQVYDALAFCRYQYARCASMSSLNRTLRDTLARQLALMVLQRAKHLRILKQLTQDREALVQQRRILQHGPTARYLV